MSTPHTQRLVVLGLAFACAADGSEWIVRDAAGREVTRVANPRGLRPHELAALLAHVRGRRQLAGRRHSLKLRFWKRLEAAIAANQDRIVTVGALSGYLHSLPRRAQIAWAKGAVRAELRRPKKKEVACAPPLP